MRRTWRIGGFVFSSAFRSLSLFLKRGLLLLLLLVGFSRLVVVVVVIVVVVVVVVVVVNEKLVFAEFFLLPHEY